MWVKAAPFKLGGGNAYKERLRGKILGRGAVFRGVGAHKPNQLLGKVLLLLFRRRRGEFSFKAV